MHENLKNVVLFMASSGFLITPDKDAANESLWNETWKRIDRFLPDLKNDLALDEPKATEGKPVVAEVKPEE